jgi:molybdopterin-guanine dinucleotide biosynthesis protein B
MQVDKRRLCAFLKFIRWHRLFLRKKLKRREREVVPIVSFVGRSHSGKTTLLERVVRELKAKGYRVAVIKHSHHDIDIDRPGKDTWRLAQAGSDVVAISAPNTVALIERVQADVDLSQIEALIANSVDIVLTEGYKNGSTAKIVVRGANEDQEALCCDEKNLATVSAQPSSSGGVQFDDDDVASIVNLVVEQINDSSAGRFGDACKKADFIPRCDTHQMKFEELLAGSAKLRPERM